MSLTQNKIAIISDSLGNGGAERFAAVLSGMLSDLDYEIYHIIINDQIDYEFSGTVFNLGKLCGNDSSWVKKIRKGILLKRYLKQENINTIIDNRTRSLLLRELFTKWIYGKRRLFYMVHSYHLGYYFPTPVFFTKIIGHDLEKIICVSKAIEDQVKIKYHFKNTITIYNAFEAYQNEKIVAIETAENYILFFGRIEEKVKNFQLLLEAYADSKIYEKGFQLLIMGDGPDVLFVEDLIRQLKLSAYVRRIPFHKNPFDYVKRAKFTVLTSRFEGFPMSIIESLALETPVISVDCKSGPSELISNEKNGLLVENHNRIALAHAMNRMIDNGILYRTCKNNARKSISHLSKEVISKQWEMILSED